MLIKDDGDRENSEAKLFVTGRDVNSTSLEISFDKDNCQWSCTGTTKEIESLKHHDEYIFHTITAALNKILDMHQNTWSGSITDFQDESRIYGYPLDYDTAQIGKWFTDFRRELKEIDNITYTKHRKGSKRMIDVKRE